MHLLNATMQVKYVCIICDDKLFEKFWLGTSNEVLMII